MLLFGAPKSTLGCSFCLQNNSIPWMGSKMLLDSSTLAFKSHLNAHALPFCGPNSLKPHFSLGKLMYHCASLVPLLLQIGSKIMFLLIHSPPSGAHFAHKPIVFHGWGAKASGFVYFSHQLPLECTCTAVL